MDDAPFAGAPVAAWGPVAGVRGPDAVLSLAALGGGRVAVGHASGAIRVRDTATGAISATLAGHASFVVLRGGRLVSASTDHGWPDDLTLKVRVLLTPHVTLRTLLLGVKRDR